jgi:hypothetical protein
VHDTVHNASTTAIGNPRNDYAHWRKYIQRENPSDWIHLQRALQYLRVYIQERAYVGWRRLGESHKGLKLRMYWSLREGLRVARPQAAVRIHQKYPKHKWNIIWENVS